MKVSKMKAVMKMPIQLEKSLLPTPLPEKLILYAVDTAHIILAIEPISGLDEKALFKEDISVTFNENRYVIELPRRIYEFYHMDEADYTIMASEINPKTIEILL